MKKRFLPLLVLLFALLGVVMIAPRLLDWIMKPTEVPTETTVSTEMVPTETLEPATEPTEAEPTTEDRPYGPGYYPTEPTTEAYDPGPPVDREKVETKLLFASDIHYLASNLTDYGQAFDGMINNSDGRVLRYLPEIWQAFTEEVIAADPEALILSGDLTLNGEKASHQELAGQLAKIEAAGISVLVIPGNHDINNPYATQYFGDSTSPVPPVSPEEFAEIYGAFGYEEAVSHAPDSLSYLYVLNETTWMLMLDSCIYEEDFEIDGEIKTETFEWMEQCLRDAYAQGITVIPVAHHNLQELSRVYVEECVIRNREEVLDLLELYLTPAFFSGHLHVQTVHKHMIGPGMPESMYGITEIVSNSLVIPPCQYGQLELHTNGTMSYHTINTDISGWAKRHRKTNPDLLEFSAFSNEHIRSVISGQTYSDIDYMPEDMKALMVEFYADLYKDYYTGAQINYDERIHEKGYEVWERFRGHTSQFRQIEGMLKDSMANNNNAEIPNPVYQEWVR